MSWFKISWLAVALVVGSGGGLAVPARAEAPPQTRQVRVNGVVLTCIEQGSGAPVVFVHGAWLDVTKEVVRQFLGPQRRAGSGTYSHPKRGHEEVLRDSAFGQLQTRQFTTTRTLTVDDVIGQQLSTSYASPAQLGEQESQFRAELSRRLLELRPDGLFDTVERTELIVARRHPAAGAR